MEKTTLINGNGQPYEREIPKVVITTYFNDGATENLIRQTGIDFKKDQHDNLVGQPETWEQFSKIFLSYDFLTHDTYNSWDGNTMWLRSNINVPCGQRLYYFKDGERFLGVDGFKG